jgi:hypothetical protein
MDQVGLEENVARLTERARLGWTTDHGTLPELVRTASTSDIAGAASASFPLRHRL